jgi:GTP-binding protein EngB required for normal cell division
MDKIPYSERDAILDGICVRLHMLPPWRNWLGHIAPISAKMGELGQLRTILKDRLRSTGLERFVNVIK